MKKPVFEAKMFLKSTGNDHIVRLLMVKLCSNTWGEKLQRFPSREFAHFVASIRIAQSKVENILESGCPDGQQLVNASQSDPDVVDDVVLNTAKRQKDLGRTGSRTRDLSHPKRESYP